VVELAVDGHGGRQVYQPKGLKSDGTSVGEWRMPLTPGPHRVVVTVATGETPDAPRQTWTAEINAVEGRLIVLAFDSARGFQLEP
jgi:hypothetical protein